MLDCYNDVVIDVETEPSCTITTRVYQSCDKFIMEVMEEKEINGTSNTLTSVAKDNLLIIPQATKEGYAVVPEGGVFDASYPDSKTRRGRVQEGGTVSPTIMASQNELLRYEGTAPSVIEPTIIDATNDFSEEEKRTYTEYSPALRSSRSGLMTTEGIRIRRLTERELYRLMDVEEKDIDTLLNSGIAKTQHAKLAGNSIVVSCLYHIFDRLLVHTEAQENEQLSIF